MSYYHASGYQGAPAYQGALGASLDELRCRSHGCQWIVPEAPPSGEQPPPICNCDAECAEQGKIWTQEVEPSGKPICADKPAPMPRPVMPLVVATVAVGGLYYFFAKRR